MEQYQPFKQILDLNKTAFENSFDAMVMIQDHTEKMVHSFWEQATWIPEEGKKVAEEWAKAYKKGRDNLKLVVEENFKKVEDLLSQNITQ